MRPRSASTTSPSTSPNGFTLVEVLVAIILIEIGLLALTASTGIVIRETLLARARTRALEIARNRVETIAATVCAELAGQTLASSGYREDWSAHLVPVSTREVRDSVTFTVQRTTRAIVLHTRTPCLP